ncbi:MAG: hypothetical protein EA357_10300 [Micavibrio sp.]|jgi:hypothetical protein|nr:MAG: hypothetical protein EA357_10300 [Micavibrio sp.]
MTAIPKTIDGEVAKNVHIPTELQNVAGAIAAQEDAIAKNPSNPLSRFSSSRKSEKKQKKSAASKFTVVPPYRNDNMRRYSTASDSPGMEIVLEVIDLLEGLTTRAAKRRHSAAMTGSFGKKGVFEKRNAPESRFMTDSPFTIKGGKKKKTSKYSLGADQARLEELKTIQFKLLEALQQKYSFSAEHIWRMENGLSNLRSDLYREYGQGFNMIEKSLRGREIGNTPSAKRKRDGQNLAVSA